MEVYNEATGGKFRGGPFPTQYSAGHFGEVLAAQPDLILWVLTPADVTNAESSETAGRADKGRPDGPSRSATGSETRRTLWKSFTVSLAQGTFGDRFKARWEQTRTSYMLKHLLIASESQEEYIRSYIKDADNANFLKANPDLKWQLQFRYFDAELTQIVGLAKNAGVPLLAVFVPNRPQAAMISKGSWAAGYDPFKLANEIHSSVVSAGGQFSDILPDYRGIPSPERNYFPVDGHPDAKGQAIISRFLVRALTSGAVAGLKASTQPDIALQSTRP